MRLKYLCNVPIQHVGLKPEELNAENACQSHDFEVLEK